MNAAPDTILEVCNLSNTYEDQPLIQDVNFSLKKGEILCLLGPSGAGKTTLLRLIAGLEKADFGSILYEKRDMRHVPPHKRNFGMMFQEYALFPHKNVWQNVAFGLEMKRCKLTEKAEKIENTLKLVGLTGFEQRKIDDLSGGERQRVALARSLAPEPQLLLLDEPFGSLDRTLRDRLTIEIREILTSLNVTTIFVTHDQSEAFAVADKVAILYEGKLQQFAPPQDLYRHPTNRTVANFLGFKNIITGEVDENGVFDSSLLHCQLPDTGQVPRRCHLLIRPDAAQLTTDTDFTTTDILLSCRIITSQFIGNRFKVTVSIHDTTLVFDLPLDPIPPQIGTMIRIKLNSAALCLLDEIV